MSTPLFGTTNPYSLDLDGVGMKQFIAGLAGWFRHTRFVLAGVANLRAPSVTLESERPDAPSGSESAYVGNLSPIATDIPWNMLLMGARLLEYPFRRRQKRSNRGVPRLVSVGLFVALVYPLIMLVAAAQMGVLLSTTVPSHLKPLAEDYAQLSLWVIGPMLLVIGTDFYKKLFPAFADLHRRGAIRERRPGAFAESIRQLYRRVNSVAWQPLFLAVAVAGTVLLHVIALQLNDRWVVALPTAVTVWMVLLTCMGWFASLFFAYKATMVWFVLRRMTSGRGLILRPVGSDLVRGDWLNRMSSLWLRVFWMVVLLGCFAFLYAATNSAWTQPAPALGLSLYILVAPGTLLIPLCSLRRVMTHQKRKATREARRKLEMAYRRLDEEQVEGWSSEGRDALLVTIDRWKMEVERMQRLPTWPMKMAHLRNAFFIYLLPFFLGIAANLATR